MTGGLAASLIVSGALTLACFAIHATFLAIAGMLVRGAEAGRGALRFVRETALLFVLATLLSVAHGLEIWLWASVFHHLAPFESFAQTLYFAAASYTTLGYGDLLPPPEWSLLAGAVASNGLLLFGFSAAFMFDAYNRRAISHR